MPASEEKTLSLPFYGLGAASFREITDTVASTSQLRKMAFALSVNGDLNGLMVLSCDETPVKTDPSSGLELLNILAARAIQALEISGIDLVMGPPERLQAQLMNRILDAAPHAKYRWSGRFAGDALFDFELFLTTEVESLNDGTSLFKPDETTDRENESCSEPYSHS